MNLRSEETCFQKQFQHGGLRIDTKACGYTVLRWGRVAAPTLNLIKNKKWELRKNSDWIYCVVKRNIRLEPVLRGRRNKSFFPPASHALRATSLGLGWYWDVGCSATD
jgi:hypothetical protein